MSKKQLIIVLCVMVASALLGFQLSYVLFGQQKTRDNETLTSNNMQIQNDELETISSLEKLTVINKAMSDLNTQELKVKNQIVASSEITTETLVQLENIYSQRKLLNKQYADLRNLPEYCRQGEMNTLFNNRSKLEDEFLSVVKSTSISNDEKNRKLVDIQKRRMIVIDDITKLLEEVTIGADKDTANIKNGKSNKQSLDSYVSDEEYLKAVISKYCDDEILRRLIANDYNNEQKIKQDVFKAAAIKFGISKYEAEDNWRTYGEIYDSIINRYKEYTSKANSDQLTKDENISNNGQININGNTNNSANEYILKESGVRELVLNDIEKLDVNSLKLARNEIYARHGYVFKTPEIDKYFRSKKWYKPIVGSNDDIILNEIELKNVKYLQQMEEILLSELNGDY